MTDQASAQAQLCQHTFQLINIHEALLKDSQRNQAFHRALERSVTPGCSVLDIGSGSGIWAIIAAKLGAARVVAIEQEPLLIGLIKALALDNGVADRIEVILGEARQVQVTGKFDVVVSETIGHVIFDEQVVPIMLDARERFLKPGGVLIPGSVSLMAAPAHYDAGYKALPSGITGSFEYFQALARNIPVALCDKRSITFLGEPQKLAHVDLSTATSGPNLTELLARWEIADTSRINCIFVWVEAELAHGVRMTTMETPSWSGTVYRLKPFEQPNGDLEFRLAMDSWTNRWDLQLANGDGAENQSYSPAIAGGELLAQTKMEPAEFRRLSNGMQFNMQFV